MSRRGKYLTYGIRTRFVLLRVVGADAHISPFSSGAMWASTPTSLIRSKSPANFIRQIFNGRRQNDSHDESCAQETRFDGRPSGRSDYGKWNDNTHNGTTCFSARQRYFASQALFSPPSFLLREKRWCRRRHPASSGCGLPRLRRGGRTESSAPTSLCKEARAFRACGAVLRPPGAMGSYPLRGDGFAPSGHKINSPPGGPP